MASKIVTQCSKNCDVIKKTEPDEGIESDGDDETSTNKNSKRNKTCACKKCMASRRPQSMTQIVTVIKITSKQAANQKPSNQTKSINDRPLEEPTRATVEIADINVIKSTEVVDTTKPHVTIKDSTEKLNDINEEDTDTSGIELVSSLEIDEEIVSPDDKPSVEEKEHTKREITDINEQDKPTEEPHYISYPFDIQFDNVDNKEDETPAENNYPTDFVFAELESQIVGLEEQCNFTSPMTEYNIPENPDDDIIEKKYVADLYNADVGFEDDKIANIKKSSEKENELGPKSIQCEKQCQVEKRLKEDKENSMDDENAKNKEKSCKPACKAYSENKNQCIVQGEAVLKPPCANKMKTIPEDISEKCKKNKCKAISKDIQVKSDEEYMSKPFPKKTTKDQEPTFEYKSDNIPQRAEKDMREEVYSVPLEEEAKKEIGNERDKTLPEKMDTFEVPKDDINKEYPKKGFPQKIAESEAIPMEYKTDTNAPQRAEKEMHEEGFSIPLEEEVKDGYHKRDKNIQEKAGPNVYDQSILPGQPETKKDNEGEVAGTSPNVAFPQKNVNRQQPDKHEGNLNNSKRAESDNVDEVITLLDKSNDKKPLVATPDRAQVQKNAQVPSEKIMTSADDPENTDVQLDSTENTKPEPANVNNEPTSSPKQKTNKDSPNESGEANRDNSNIPDDGNPSTPEEMEQYLKDLWNDFKNSKYAKKLVAAGILFTLGLELAKECNFMPIPLQTYVPTRF